MVPIAEMVAKSLVPTNHKINKFIVLMVPIWCTYCNVMPSPYPSDSRMVTLHRGCQQSLADTDRLQFVTEIV